ncbi:hypothetical protein [Wolbachia endosymbiont of Folsomia candida]|nr:hypothetical protein [Wolbachia endosymbiont of Folsomia candida]
MIKVVSFFILSSQCPTLLVIPVRDTGISFEKYKPKIMDSSVTHWNDR